MKMDFEKVVEQVKQECLNDVAHDLATVETLQAHRDAHAERLAQAGESDYQSPVLEGRDRAIAELTAQ